MSSLPRLSRSSLSSISLPSPSYLPASLSPGIVHFGLGNFHRAHLALYNHNLFSRQLDLDWSIVGANVLPSSAAFHKTFSEQDYLYTLMSQSPSRTSPRIIGSITDHLPPAQFATILRELLHPHIRIVSLTITEGGYFQDSTGTFDASHPSIIADGTNDVPCTVFGILADSLRIRHEMGIDPFTVLSCDNVPHNGVVTRDAVTGVARLRNPKSADWIQNNVAFPNNMVDGITPETDERGKQFVKDTYGFEDQVPVFSEQWTQWVMEDHFTMDRPRWEDVGAQFVDDVSGYEAMKIRVLNGGHAVIAYPGGLLDIEFAHEAMAHPVIRAFLDKVQREEILPEVKPPKGESAQKYYESICDRFSNPKMEDTVRRLCLDGSNRQPKFIMLSIRDRIREGKSVDGLALESALWCRYCYGESECGKKIEKNDPNWDELRQRAKRAKEEPRVWLDQETVYGDVKDNEQFVRSFETALLRIWKDGAIKAMEHYINE